MRACCSPVCPPECVCVQKTCWNPTTAATEDASKKPQKNVEKMNYDYCHAKEQAKCQSDIF